MQSYRGGKRDTTDLADELRVVLERFPICPSGAVGPACRSSALIGQNLTAGLSTDHDREK